jgi:hypothetical protein
LDVKMHLLRRREAAAAEAATRAEETDVALIFPHSDASHAVGVEIEEHQPLSLSLSLLFSIFLFLSLVDKVGATRGFKYTLHPFVSIYLAPNSIMLR